MNATQIEVTADEVAREVHPFERAGLGKAPFRFVSCEDKVYVPYHGGPALPGGSCDYCSHEIIGCYWIASADGKRFKVGCDCVEKLDRADNRLVSEVKKAKLARSRKMAAARKEAKLDKERAEIASSVDRYGDVEATLAAQPHPSIPERTMADYVIWMSANAGHAGKLKAARIVNGAEPEKIFD